VVKRLAREEVAGRHFRGRQRRRDLRVARAAGSGVTVFCDSADKYLSDEFWTD
jgi:hypothetical protein